jgi:hypothetical protein
MVKGRQKVSLTKEAILAKISSYDIYRFYQGPFKVNQVCINKHRGEKDPSLIIGNRLSQGLTHKDLGDYSWRGDCFHFVMQIFRCDYDTALRIIDKDFDLGIRTGQLVNVKPSVITWETPELELKRPPLIQIVYYSKMSKAGLDYWAKLDQGEDDLKRENIFQPKEIWRNKRKIPLGDLLTFGYLYEDVEAWKIYRPFAPKRTENTFINQWKWDTNVPFDYVDNAKAIKTDCSKIFLTKSKKDRMVLMKALQNDCMSDFQAEDPACIPEAFVSQCEKVPSRFVVSDNDKKGKEFSWWLTKKHGFKHINVPDSYLETEPKCTDFADLCYNYGMETVVNYFKIKGLL